MNLQEWIEHYLWQGVDHFYLIDNGSDDDFMPILQPYIEQGRVTLHQLLAKHQQVEHYNTVFNESIKGNVEWLIVADVDEFYYGQNGTVAQYLQGVPATVSSVFTQWKMFGSSGLDKHPIGHVRESFIERAFKLHTIGKSIVRAAKVDSLHIHNHTMIDGENIKENDVLQLNHYAIQSREYFAKVKMTRGAADSAVHENIRDWAYFNNYDNKGFTDTELRDMVKRLKED